MHVSADAFRGLMARWPSGVAVFTVLGEHHAKSALVTSFCSASLNPPLVQVGLTRASRTHAALTATPNLHVVVSMLAERVDADREELVQSVERAAVEGQLAGHPAVMSSALCTVHDVFAAGDHDIFLLAVCSTHQYQDVQPAVYHDHKFKGLREREMASHPLPQPAINEREKVHLHACRHREFEADHD